MTIFEIAIARAYAQLLDQKVRTAKEEHMLAVLKQAVAALKVKELPATRSRSAQLSGTAEQHP